MQDTSSRRAVDLLMLPQQYRSSRQHMFPSDGSLQWYVRRHRTALVSAGAILLIAGRTHIDEQRFDAFALEQGKQDAKRIREAS